MSSNQASWSLPVLVSLTLLSASAARPADPSPAPPAAAEPSAAEPTPAEPASTPAQAGTPAAAGPAVRAPLPVPAETPRTIDLPAPQQSGGLPLMDALARPAVGLNLEGSRLSMQHLSNLLWAGSGRAKGETTAAQTHATEVYVLLKAGAFVYDPDKHSLRQVVAQDIRGLCGLSDPRWRAPVTLVYVADLAKATRPTLAAREVSAALDAGTMAQSVSLYCASESLSAGERSIANSRVLARRLRLRPEQRIVAAQVVGYQQK